jgi:uncharacterized C2H2 Zn-finger protein
MPPTLAITVVPHYCDGSYISKGWTNNKNKKNEKKMKKKLPKLPSF